MLRIGAGLLLWGAVLAGWVSPPACGESDRAEAKSDREELFNGGASGRERDPAMADAVGELLDEGILEDEEAALAGDHERLQWRRRLYREFDRNKDGKLNGSEREKAKKLLADDRQGSLQERCRRGADKDRDGKLNDDEESRLKRKVEELTRRRQEHRKRLQSGFDDNRDGKLSSAERGTLRKEWKHHLEGGAAEAEPPLEKDEEMRAREEEKKELERGIEKDDDMKAPR